MSFYRQCETICLPSLSSPAPSHIRKLTGKLNRPKRLLAPFFSQFYLFLSTSLLSAISFDAHILFCHEIDRNKWRMLLNIFFGAKVFVCLRSSSDRVLENSQLKRALDTNWKRIRIDAMKNLLFICCSLIFCPFRFIHSINENCMRSTCYQNRKKG